MTDLLALADSLRTMAAAFDRAAIVAASDERNRAAAERHAFTCREAGAAIERAAHVEGTLRKAAEAQAPAAPTTARLSRLLADTLAGTPQQGERQ